MTFFYAVPRSLLTETDVLRTCDADARRAHAFGVEAEMSPENLKSGFEGRFSAMTLEACHAGHRGPATFTMKVSSDNGGVYIRRLFDQRAGRQAARISVDGRVVGTWYTVEGNAVLRWAERDYFLPRSVTAGKDSLQIRIEPVSDAPPWDASEYRALSVEQR